MWRIPKDWSSGQHIKSHSMHPWSPLGSGKRQRPGYRIQVWGFMRFYLKIKAMYLIIKDCRQSRCYVLEVHAGMWSICCFSSQHAWHDFKKVSFRGQCCQAECTISIVFQLWSVSHLTGLWTLQAGFFCLPDSKLHFLGLQYSICKDCCVCHKNIMWKLMERHGGLNKNGKGSGLKKLNRWE